MDIRNVILAFENIIKFLLSIPGMIEIFEKYSFCPKDKSLETDNNLLKNGDRFYLPRTFYAYRVNESFFIIIFLSILSLVDGRLNEKVAPFLSSLLFLANILPS
ncbi:MAG: hypothetical protein ACTHKC_05660 [Candidatus Nitrosocosmicus sp.]